MTGAAPPRAPGLGELFEAAVTAVVDPAVFRRAAQRPAPSFGAAGGLALACGVAALAVNFAHTAVAGPGPLQRFSPAILAAIGAAALGLYASLLLLLAVLLYAMGSACGGKGGFERGLQAAAMLSVLVPVQMLCNWFAFAWLLPALLAAWVAAGALQGLFGAPAVPARAACAVLAAGAIGLQFVGRTLSDRAQEAYAVTRTIGDSGVATAELAHETSAVEDQARAMLAALPATPAPAPVSSLDLLRGGPSEMPGAAAPVQAPPSAVLAAAQGMQSNAEGMLDALGPLLATIASSKTQTAQQKADMTELTGLIQDLKVQITSGQKIDNAVFARKMARYQQLLSRVMANARPPAVDAAPAPGQMPHLKLPKDQQ